ncbi:hypothetical protein BIFGAL_02574 [Bifidobacterium gallicum DSM 20093 = LMG 11596]|uniref:Uncharacterized protein n=1 Tax=Bifidobacterium gallicum DSM 20093 = LMG 11596 TaxID=561180 RepID=D1NS19_9BIFI|nr:hypothetical protein BIFGAL_02574 [Bifidobacterium gallicum DSM 20093 = LMG 11596]
MAPWPFVLKFMRGNGANSSIVANGAYFAAGNTPSHMQRSVLRKNNATHQPKGGNRISGSLP